VTRIAQLRLIALAALVALALGALAPPTASARACAPVVNPYPDSRYEGVDLRDIRATGIACSKARKVVRGAHRKALGITPPPSGIRRFQWRGWTVVGNLRPTSDKYTATRGGDQINWRF
jgi:hypothetical protein